jgi:diazepam-binding inhibitor (GABA receptor modulator, acyl-CoA-binding protein)
MGGHLEDPMSLDEEFASAQERVKTLTTRPSNEELLELYALFKQGALGDVQGKRPGIMDFKGRAKYDAWAAKKGTSQQAAKERYVALVDRLVR